MLLGTVHTAFANVAFDGNALATLRGLVSHRKREASIEPVAAVDCAAMIQPMDISPIRSPLAVHTVLARRFAGRDVVEIGTRMGDAIACFALVARSAVAVELMPKYCKALANRTSRANIRTGSFRIACGDYRNASLDADYITWWQQAPGLVNQALLSHLHHELLAGRIRKGASAMVLFDPSESEDVSSFEQIRSANRNSNAVEWVELVEYDERALCEERHRVKPPSKKNAKWETCDRAQGAFAVASIRLAQYARELRQWRRGAPGPSL